MPMILACLFSGLTLGAASYWKERDFLSGFIAGMIPSAIIAWIATH